MTNAEIGMASDMDVSDNDTVEPKKRFSSGRRFFWSSSLARRIIAFNLIALCALLLGMLYLSQFRSNIATERASALNVESTLYAQLLQERASHTDTTGTTADKLLAIVTETLPRVGQSEVRIFDVENNALKILKTNNESSKVEDKKNFSYFLDSVADKIGSWFKAPTDNQNSKSADEIAKNLAARIVEGKAISLIDVTQSGQVVVASGRPIVLGGAKIGSVVVSTPEGLMDELRKQERNNILQLFILAAGLSVILSLVLANTIANPIHDLASAMESGTTTKLRKNDPDRVRIPDMTGRDDEIGYLSSAMRNMTSALYHRIETNEQFAADVAHEIKNPLASLRSAIETLRIAPEGVKRHKLLDVVEHDVRRLDRLVSDISNASRLDSELVTEEEENFDVTIMLERIVDFHGLEARESGIELIYDKPENPIFIDGLEERLAQVFVNLVTNAVSFCEKGDAIRLWVRSVENRVLVVVEDTGQGIPEDSLTKVFKRFYSNRAVENFGNNSGLGLSISKEIVEAHGGVIWAENIYSKGAPEGTAPLGARFVVGLPG